MMKGRLTARYDLPIPDFEVRGLGPFTQQIAGPPAWTASIEPSPTGLALQIEIDTEDPSEAAGTADEYARRFADYFTFWLCGHEISHLVTARRLGSPSFQGDDSHSLYVFGVEAVGLVGTLTARVTKEFKKEDIAQVLAAFSLSEAAPPPVFANDLVIARQMYLAGQRVESVIARFLITYAAMAVWARFKRGAGAQQQIDAVLKDEDPTMPVHPSPKGKGTETDYTRARNAFIHAEDRGRDPAAAMVAIEALAQRFQTIVGNILRKG